jgi:hypothetical protein
VDVYQIGMRREATGNSKMRARTKPVIVGVARPRGLRKDKGKRMKTERTCSWLVGVGVGEGFRKDKGKRTKDEIGKLP